MAIKVAAPSISRILQNGLRSAVAALLVSGLMWWRDSKFSLTDGSFWPGLTTGLLFAAEFLCVSIGLNYTAASHMSVFVYTVPIFTVLCLHWLQPHLDRRYARCAGRSVLGRDHHHDQAQCLVQRRAQHDLVVLIDGYCSWHYPQDRLKWRR